MTCTRCGRESPTAPFCTFCGTRQGGREQVAGGRRADRFAAHPNEAVLYPAVLTTLFPHLGNRQVNEFRWALLIGAAVIVLLALAGLVASAILAGAVLLPVTYVLYLYEVRVYRDAPVPVLALTVGAGILLGVVVTLAVDYFAPLTPLFQSTLNDLQIDLTGVVVFGVLVPAIIELIKPLPALWLRRTGLFPETIDGLVFGVAAGLGFSVAQTIIHMGSVLVSSGGAVDPGSWIFPLLTISLLLPLMHGSTTGLISSALWPAKGQRRAIQPLLAIAAAIAANIAFVLGSAFAVGIGAPSIVAIAWQVLVVGALLVLIRVVLHRALLEEANDLGVAPFVCPNCDSHSMAAGFCPVCGMATPASRKEAKPAVPARAAANDAS